MLGRTCRDHRFTLKTAAACACSNRMRMARLVCRLSKHRRTLLTSAKTSRSSWKTQSLPVGAPLPRRFRPVPARQIVSRLAAPHAAAARAGMQLPFQKIIISSFPGSGAEIRIATTEPRTTRGQEPRPLIKPWITLARTGRGKTDAPRRGAGQSRRGDEQAPGLARRAAQLHPGRNRIAGAWRSGTFHGSLVANQLTCTTGGNGIRD